MENQLTRLVLDDDDSISVSRTFNDNVSGLKQIYLYFIDTVIFSCFKPILYAFSNYSLLGLMTCGLIHCIWISQDVPRT